MTDNAIKKKVRCAIYTRKSTEEGLEQDFNTLDAQRESGEAYIASQKSEGWTCLSDRYDDGGFSGGNMERPAVQRLMVDIQAGKVDCVLVYKVDRLSRSLLDFARIMEVLERHKVSFVSVTQQFNTTTSMGRLMLNVLLSFAQFEREIISERTRDKIAAARRRGKWSGGPPVLGYDLLRRPSGSKLIVNAQEADQARRIFETYLKTGSLLATVAELDRLGWRNKAWTTRAGRQRGGSPFDKANLARTLSNVTYLGKVTHKGSVYAGEHEAIIDEALFGRVQSLLRRNRRSGGAYTRNKYGALLKGLVRCKACGCAMSHHFVTRGRTQYRYYVCVNAQKRGWSNCPAPSLPAGELERFVVERISRMGKDPDLVRDVLRRSREEQAREIEQMREERESLEKQARELCQEIGRMAAEAHRDPHATAGLLSLQERLQEVERRMTAIREESTVAEERATDEDEMAGAVEAFDPIWAALSPGERERVIHLLVQRVEFDAAAETVSVTFRPAGIKAFAQEERTACLTTV